MNTRFSLSMEMSRLTRDETAEPVSRNQILRHARGQGEINFPCSADHEQDWQLYSFDPYFAIRDDHTYIHTYIRTHILRPTGHRALSAHAKNRIDLRVLVQRLRRTQIATEQGD